jgi:hypothetical protein
MGDKNDSLRSDADGTARQSKSEVTLVASQHTGAANQSKFTCRQEGVWAIKTIA